LAVTALYLRRSRLRRAAGWSLNLADHATLSTAEPLALNASSPQLWETLIHLPITIIIQAVTALLL